MPNLQTSTYLDNYIEAIDSNGMVGLRGKGLRYTSTPDFRFIYNKGNFQWVYRMVRFWKETVALGEGLKYVPHLLDLTIGYYIGLCKFQWNRALGEGLLTDLGRVGFWTRLVIKTENSGLGERSSILKIFKLLILAAIYRLHGPRRPLLF